MEILMFTPVFQPHIGGVEKHVKRISEELIKKEHNVTIITQKHDTKLLDYEKIGEIEVYRFDKVKMFDIWKWIFKNRKLIRKADILHFHDYVTFINWYLPFRFIYVRKKNFITFHGYEGVFPIPKFVILLRKITEYLTIGNICIGPFITKWYGTNADYLSFGGVDRLKLDKTTENGSILYIGRLEPDTGIIEFVKAMKMLKNKKINIEMNICGDGTLKDEIENYIKKHKLNIYLHGNIDEVNTFVKECNFAFLSGYLSILEAMICKKLVFSIYSNELRKDYLTSIPNSDKIMIITNSLDDLTKKIEYYFNNPNEKRIITERAYKFAKNQTWKKLSEIYLELWSK